MPNADTSRRRFRPLTSRRVALLMGARLPRFVAAVVGASLLLVVGFVVAHALRGPEPWHAGDQLTYEASQNATVEGVVFDAECRAAGARPVHLWDAVAQRVTLFCMRGDMALCKVGQRAARNSWDPGATGCEDTPVAAAPARHAQPSAPLMGAPVDVSGMVTTGTQNTVIGYPARVVDCAPRIGFIRGVRVEQASADLLCGLTTGNF